ncbi:phosphatidate cytidylyltransferase [Tautonia sociabilis]|uniref:Phosphatidate cytidylyltransferase n=2 Tax=Tautonia sociabilis TaxID=2080755 RepID=A0A432MH05_9BACT|nr:phosphatidate cytidylyltransferase [Tautonia sociabilis]
MAAAFVLVLLVDTIYFAPWFPLWLLAMMVVMGLGAREISSLFQQTSARPDRELVIGGVLAVVLSNWGPHLVAELTGLDDRPGAAVEALAWPLWAFVAVVMFTFIAQSARFEHPGGTMATIAGTVLAVAYVGLLGSFLVQFRWLESPYRGLVPLAALVATAKGADMGAYFAGRVAGRHKLWPRLSPNKTVEGAVGGMVLGILSSGAVFGAARLLFNTPVLSWVEVLGFGLLVGSAAQLGDLMESMIKRDCERKDSSATLPGFGGVLDVLDSLLFAGPVAYGYWLIFGPP